MSLPTKCKTCGCELSASALEGLCPDCLGKLVLENPVANPAASASTQTGVAGANLVISWTGAGTLQLAQNVAGPWALASGVTNSTYTVRPSATQRYFRLRVP